MRCFLPGETLKSTGAQSMSTTRQLGIPDAALRDEKSYEIARVWVAEKAEHVSLLIGTWDDPVAWGIVLADLARHVANGYEQDKGPDRSETLQRIRVAMTAELDDPTDNPTGNLLTM
jgi:Domain of unknown function (DUF5076)